MNFCGNCGTQLQPAMSFCGNCGTAVAAPPATSTTANGPSPSADDPAAVDAPDAPAVTQPTAQPAAAQPAAGTGRVLPPPPPGGIPTTSTSLLPQVDWKKAAAPLIVGNWVGAGIIAAVTLAVTLLLAVIVTALISIDDMSFGNHVTTVLAFAAAAFGVDATASTDAGHASLGVFTLGITLPAAAAALFTFRRVTAAYTRPLAALLDGIRAALLISVVLFIAALLVRTDLADDLTGDDEWSWLLDVVFYDLTYGIERLGALFMPLLTLTALFAVAVLLRRDWLPERAATIHDWVQAPLRGLIALIVLLPVLAVITIIATLITGDTNDDLNSFDDWLMLLGLAIAFLPNLGIGALSLGVFGQVGGSANLDRSARELFEVLGSTDRWERVTYLTGEGEPGLWVTIVIAPAAIAAATFIVARASTSVATVLRNLGVWVAGLLLAVPCLIRLANVHVAGDVEGADSDDEFSFEFAASAVAGIHGISTTLMVALYALAAAAVLAGLTGALNYRDVSQRATDAARRIQQQGEAAGGATPGSGSGSGTQPPPTPQHAPGTHQQATPHAGTPGYPPPQT